MIDHRNTSGASAHLVAGYRAYSTAADAAAPASGTAPGTTPATVAASPFISEATVGFVASVLGGTALSFNTHR